MSALDKAHLIELRSNGTTGPPVPVQFNPATMRLQITNSAEGGQSQSRQVRQYLGTSSTTLTLDLVFDTADEGDTGNPHSVRDRTAIVEKYVLPMSQARKKQAPPRLSFQWGPFRFDGMVSNVSIDFDHFAGNGTPLRAKASLTMKEQNPEYQYPGTEQQGGAPAPGQIASALPGSGAAPATQTAAAIGGESAADFATRQGLDPAAWRGLDIGAGSSLSLDAGAEVGFSADLSVSAGLGVTTGFEAGVSASLEASVGLDVSASVGVSASAWFSADVSAGLALSAAGGVTTAIEQVQNASVAAAVQQSAQAFAQNLPAAAGAPVQASAAAVLATTPSPQLGPPEQPRPPLAQTGLPSASQQAAAPPAPQAPAPDSRATSFGFGVPLRSQLGSAVMQRAAVSSGRAVLGQQLGTGDPPTTSNPTIAPWIALPAAELTTDTAGVIQMKKRPQPSCGCGRVCGCHGRN